MTHNEKTIKLNAMINKCMNSTLDNDFKAMKVNLEESKNLLLELPEEFESDELKHYIMSHFSYVYIM